MRPVRARKQQASLDGVVDAVEELHKRVRREIERCETAGRGKATALTGGWAKLGNRTQTLLCATIEWISDAEGLDALEELRREAPPERTLEEASFLTLGKVIRSMARLASSDAPPVRRVVHDVLARGSLIAEITKKRRDKVHEREQGAKLAEDVRLLRSFERLLCKVKADTQSSPLWTSR